MAKRRSVEANKKRAANERARQAQMKRGGGAPRNPGGKKKDSAGFETLKFERSDRKTPSNRKRPGVTSDAAPGGKRQKMDPKVGKLGGVGVKKGMGRGKKDGKVAGKRGFDQKGGRAAKSGRVKPGRPAEGEARMKKSEWKAMVREQKGLHNKNFNLVQEVVFMWEKMRPKNVTTAQKSKLVTSILAKTGGKVAELVKNHRASRVIQFCLKEGSDAQRKAIMKEVKDNILELARDKYGRHLVLKLVNYVPVEHRGALVKIFGGGIVQLLKHNYGADVVADLYYQVSDEDKVTMVLECYSKELSLQQQLLLREDEGGGNECRAPPRGTSFDSDTSLESILPKLDTVRRTSIMKGLMENLNSIVEKGLLHPHLVHKLLMEFLLNGPTLLVDDMVKVIAETGDGIMKIMHTKEGAASAVMVLAYGSAKVRKVLVKGFKDYVKDAALDEWGHLVVLAALSLVDDTSLTTKVFVKEIVKHLKELCFGEFSSRVLLELIHPGGAYHMPNEIRSILHPKQRQVKVGQSKSKGDREGDSEVEELSEPDESNGSEEKVRVLGQSLKDPLVRCKEVLGDGNSSLTKALLELCSSETGSLMRSQFGANVLVEIASGGSSPFTELARPEISAIQDAIVELVVSKPGEGMEVDLELLEEGSEESDEGEAVEDYLDVSADEGDGDDGTSDSDIDPLAETLEAELSHSESDIDREEVEATSSDADPLDSQSNEQQDEGATARLVAKKGAGLLKTTGGSNSLGKAHPRHVLNYQAGRRALVRLVKGSSKGQDNGGKFACMFVNKLWENAFKSRCSEHIGKEGEVVVCSFLDCGVASIRKDAHREVEPIIEGSITEWMERVQCRMEFDHSKLWKKMRNPRRKNRKKNKPTD